MAVSVLEGDLASDPFAHIVVHACDRRLTGTLFLEEPSGIQHVVSFSRGAPVKVRPGDGYALLGELLINAGAITESALEGALSVPALLGDALLVAGFVDHGTLESVAERQFYTRMVRLFGLPAETTYRFVNGSDGLSTWGGDPASVDPLALLWAGLRKHARASTMMDSTIDRIAGGPLRVHARAPLERFAFDAPELEAAILMRERATSLDCLIASAIASEEIVRRIVYMLAITRNIDLGQDAPPVGLGDHNGDEGPPVESTSRPGHQAVGRVRLKTVAHRIGAAAPDLPGPGEPTSTRVTLRGDERDE
jgi:hypothetical protein